jgi:16S rRNA processing protein RimM
VSALLQFGYVSKAHSLTGEVLVKTFDPTSQIFNDVERVALRLRDGAEIELGIDSVRDGTKGTLIIGFDGVESRESALRLVGATLLAFRDDLPQPTEGEFFQGDLVGLEAFDEQGRPLGAVAEIWNSGPVPNLVIRGPGLPEVWVPFAEEFVVSTDVKGRRLVVRPPEIT